MRSKRPTRCRDWARNRWELGTIPRRLMDLRFHRQRSSFARARFGNRQTRSPARLAPPWLRRLHTAALGQKCSMLCRNPARRSARAASDSSCGTYCCPPAKPRLIDRLTGSRLFLRRCRLVEAIAKRKQPDRQPAALPSTAPALAPAVPIQVAGWPGGQTGGSPAAPDSPPRCYCESRPN